MMLSASRPAEAEPLYRRALAINEKNDGLDDPEVATSLHHLADVMRIINRHGEAQTLLRRALGIDETKLGPNIQCGKRSQHAGPIAASN